MFFKKTRNLAVTALAFLMAITLGFGVMGFKNTQEVNAESTSVSLAGAIATGGSKYWKGVNGLYYTRTSGSLSVTSDGLQARNTVVVAFNLTEKAQIGIELKSTKDTAYTGKSFELYSITEEDYTLAENAANDPNPKKMADSDIAKFTKTKIDTVTFDLGKKETKTITFTGEGNQGYESGYYVVYLPSDINSTVSIATLIFTPTVKTYTVSFNTNGAESGEITAQSVEEGKTATEPTPAPTKAGYVFHGWHHTDEKGADNGVHYDFTTPVVSDVNLIAVWYDATSKTEITDFENTTNSETSDSTERLLNGTYSVDYTGQSREEVRAAAIALLPKTINGTVDGGSVSVTLTWENEIAADTDDDGILDIYDEIVGIHTYVAKLQLPENHYTKLWLRAKVTVNDIREKVTAVNEEIEVTVAVGADLNKVLPEQISVKTDKQESVMANVTWETEGIEVVAGDPITVNGKLEDKYSLNDGVTIQATVTVKSAESNVGEKQANVASWDARNQTSKISENTNKDAEGNYIILEQDGVKITAQSTVYDGTTNAGGNAIEIIGPNDKQKPSRPTSWIKIEVAFSARLNVRAGANGSGSRTFNINTSANSYNENVIATKSHSVGATDVFKSDDYVVKAEVKAGTYYFWNASNENSAQLYEIVIDEITLTEDYAYTAGETLIEENGLPAQEGYELIGWVAPSGKIETAGTAAQEEGKYAPLYVKFTMTGSINLGSNGGVKYSFNVEFINGDKLDAEKLKVSLSLTAAKTVDLTDANFTYENGVLVSNALITGWTEDTAKNWRDQAVTASITVDFGNGVTKKYESEQSLSASDIAQQMVDEEQATKEQLAMYLGE